MTALTARTRQAMVEEQAVCVRRGPKIRIGTTAMATSSTSAMTRTNDSQGQAVLAYLPDGPDSLRRRW